MRLLAALLFGFACICPAAEPAAGRWEGSIQIPGAEQRLIVDLAQTPDGRWSGSATLPGFDIKGAPLTGLTVKNPAVSFTLKDNFGDPKFVAHLAPNETLAGDMTQAGNTAPFSLRRTGEPQVDPPRTPGPLRKELEGEWRGEFNAPGKTMRASLTIAGQASGGTVKFVVGNKKDTELPVSFVSLDGDWLTIEAHDYGISYEGRLHAAGGEIEGVFAQGGFLSPLVLRRMEHAHAQ